MPTPTPASTTVDDGNFGIVGGTSAGSPQWAALAALANQGRASAGETTLGTGQAFGTNSVLYSLAGGTSYLNANHDFSDITTGSNGHSATTGYDEATGLGSPIANNLIPDLINADSAKAPTLVNPASATPSPVVGKTAKLTVLANDAKGEASLNHTWTTTSTPSGVPAPTFSINGTNASKNDTVTFFSACTYVFNIRAVDADGLSVSSSVNVTVNSTLTTFGLSPVKVQLSAGQSFQLVASGVDQFGSQVSTSASFTWALVSGGGTLTQSGLYTAPAAGTVATVRATTGGLSVMSTIYVLSNSWLATDIGSPSVGGDSSDNGAGLFSLLGGGTGIGGSSDQLQYAYLPVTGDSTIQAQVATVVNTNTAARAGVMFRNDISAGAANVMVAITPSSGLVYSFRSVANGSTTTVTIPRVTAGEYVKIVRVGNIFTSFYSANGVTWTQVAAPLNLALSPAVDVGLAVSSLNATVLNTSTFNHVLADGNPTVAAAAKANPNPVTTTTTTLSVLGADAAGEPALTYTWVTTASPVGAPTPTFATNATNASKTDVVTFFKSGSYTFKVTLSNALGYSTTSSVTVTVVPTLTNVQLTPSSATVSEGGTQQFAAGTFDQFGLKLASQPYFTFSMVAGGAGGKISSSGLYTAPNHTGIDHVNVTGGGFAAVAQITVTGGSTTVPPLALKSNPAPLANVGSVSVGWGSDSASLVTASDGLRLLPVGRKTDLPWENIRALTVVLSQAESLVASDIAVTGIKVANYGPVTVMPVAGSSSSYLITLAQPIALADRVTLTIASPQIVTYTRRLDVLPGDVNDDGIVSVADATMATSYLMSTTIAADIFGDGVVSSKSVKAIQLFNGTTLPVLS
jgi:hypothetical protein